MTIKLWTQNMESFKLEGPHSITSIDPTKFLVQIAKSKYKINSKTEIRITDLSLNSKPTK